MAAQALEESRSEVEAALNGHSVVIVIGTGGKGTGAGTMFPVARMARQQKKLVIPIFVRPSFERHEVDKRRFDHALHVIDQFDRAQIRLVEILNDQGYVESDPQSQAVVWERMNLPIARGLRGLIYVLSDLSQVDPSDLSTLFAGHGRIRIGFSEIDPSPLNEPSDSHVEDAVQRCWQNAYYAFSKPVGTSLICIQGDWSNVVDAKIKSGLAARASGGAADNPYIPLYARAAHAPRPWGVTALFAEYTGNHPPLDVDWSLERKVVPLVGIPESRNQPAAAGAGREIPTAAPKTSPASPAPLTEEAKPGFASFWEFAVAVNRGSRAALALAADGPECDVPIDGGEVRKLLDTVWFRGVIPRLSQEWRERILESLVASTPIPNHMVKVDRRAMRLSEVSQAQLKDLFTKTHLADTVRADLELLFNVSRLWGEQALRRFQFTTVPEHMERSRLTNVLQGFRK